MIFFLLFLQFVWVFIFFTIRFEKIKFIFFYQVRTISQKIKFYFLFSRYNFILKTF